jgi:S1/P1 Nuclease
VFSSLHKQTQQLSKFQNTIKHVCAISSSTPPLLLNFSSNKHRRLGQRGPFHGLQNCRGKFIRKHKFQISLFKLLGRELSSNLKIKLQSYLTEKTKEAVLDLLPEVANGDLASVCSWPDEMRFRYRWSSPLHYINTPGVCNYDYSSKFSLLSNPKRFHLVASQLSK